MARQRQRARDRKARGADQGLTQPDAAAACAPRRDPPREHPRLARPSSFGEVEEFEADLVAGAEGVPLDGAAAQAFGEGAELVRGRRRRGQRDRGRGRRRTRPPQDRRADPRRRQPGLQLPPRVVGRAAARAVARPPPGRAGHRASSLGFVRRRRAYLGARRRGRATRSSTSSSNDSLEQALFMYRWYVVNTYSGHENKVKQNLEHRVVSLNQKRAVRQVVVPTETVSRDEGQPEGHQSRSARCPATCSSTWSSTTTRGSSSRARPASPASSARPTSPSR